MTAVRARTSSTPALDSTCTIPLSTKRILVELRRLARLDPAGGALHARDADRGGAGVHAANVFFDDLRLFPAAWMTVAFSMSVGMALPPQMRYPFLFTFLFCSWADRNERSGRALTGVRVALAVPVRWLFLTATFNRLSLMGRCCPPLHGPCTRHFTISRCTYGGSPSGDTFLDLRIEKRPGSMSGGRSSCMPVRAGPR